MKQNEYSAITDLCGLARTRNLAGCLEQAPAECGIATEDSLPMAAYGKFPQRSEDKKPTPFRSSVVHEVIVKVPQGVKTVKIEFDSKQTAESTSGKASRKKICD